MSIVLSLMRLVDAMQWREEKAKHERWMKQFATGDPDDGPTPPEVTVQGPPRRYRCRCCGHEEQDARYCPECLADTMRPL